MKYSEHESFCSSLRSPLAKRQRAEELEKALRYQTIRVEDLNNEEQMLVHNYLLDCIEETKRECQTALEELMSLRKKLLDEQMEIPKELEDEFTELIQSLAET